MQPQEHPEPIGGTAFSPAFQEDLSRLFRLRRDVRRFRTDPLPEAAVLELLAAAHTAPSVGLSQPWRFVRVLSGPAREAVRASFERANSAAATAYEDERSRLYRSLKLAGLREAPNTCWSAVTPKPTRAMGWAGPPCPPPFGIRWSAPSRTCGWRPAPAGWPSAG